MNNIPYEQRAEAYRSAIDTYGPTLQRYVAVEEMAELTKELCKAARGADNRDALVEEIADVTIMMEQLRILFDVNEAVGSMMDYKVLRLAARIRETLKSRED